MRRRTLVSGFTLVELLVVIAIIGILASLLLPAVQAAREASRRVSCLNNQKQLSLAVINFEATHKRLPPSGLVDVHTPEYEGRTGKMFSWIVLILPYLEEQNLYDRFDFDRSVLNQPGEPQAMQLAVLLCPSDESREAYFQHNELTAGKRFGKGNYAAYVSPMHVELQNQYPGALMSGKTWRTKNITDGLSKTLLLSEIRVRRHPEDQRGAWALPWNGASQIAFDMHSRYSDVYWADDISLGLTQRPNNISPNIDMLYDCPDLVGAQLEGMPCGVFNTSMGHENHYISAAPRSRHPGGVLVAFMDGRLGFLPDDVDEYAMANLVSVHDYYRPTSNPEGYVH